MSEAVLKTQAGEKRMDLDSDDENIEDTGEKMSDSDINYIIFGNKTSSNEWKSVKSREKCLEITARENDISDGNGVRGMDGNVYDDIQNSQRGAVDDSEAEFEENKVVIENDEDMEEMSNDVENAMEIDADGVEIAGNKNESETIEDDESEIHDKDKAMGISDKGEKSVVADISIVDEDKNADEAEKAEDFKTKELSDLKVLKPRGSVVLEGNKINIVRIGKQVIPSSKVLEPISIGNETAVGIAADVVKTVKDDRLDESESNLGFDIIEVSDDEVAGSKMVEEVQPQFKLKPKKVLNVIRPSGGFKNQSTRFLMPNTFGIKKPLPTNGGKTMVMKPIINKSSDSPRFRMVRKEGYAILKPISPETTGINGRMTFFKPKMPVPINGENKVSVKTSSSTAVEGKVVHVQPLKRVERISSPDQQQQSQKKPSIISPNEVVPKVPALKFTNAVKTISLAEAQKMGILPKSQTAPKTSPTSSLVKIVSNASVIENKMGAMGTSPQPGKLIIKPNNASKKPAIIAKPTIVSKPAAAIKWKSANIVKPAIMMKSTNMAKSTFATRPVIVTSEGKPIVIDVVDDENDTDVNIIIQAKNLNPQPAMSNEANRLLSGAFEELKKQSNVKFVKARIEKYGESRRITLPRGITLKESVVLQTGNNMVIIPQNLCKKMGEKVESMGEQPPPLPPPPAKKLKLAASCTSDNPTKIVKLTDHVLENCSNMPSVDDKLRKKCNCTKSQCLKLYCECFANGEYCLDCNCVSCFNDVTHQENRIYAIKCAIERNPYAFKARSAKTGPREFNNKGCNCKKSNCLKNYCECYENQVICTEQCRCTMCHNTQENANIQGKFEEQCMISKNKMSSLEQNNFNSYSFLNEEIIQATAECVLSEAAKVDPRDVSDYESAYQAKIILEFSRCITGLINVAEAMKTK